MSKAAAVLALLTFLVGGGLGLYGESTYTSLKTELDLRESACDRELPYMQLPCVLAIDRWPLYRAEEMRNNGIAIAFGGPFSIWLFVLFRRDVLPKLQRGARVGGRVAATAGRIAADELGKRSARATKDVVGAVAQMSDSAQGRTRECPFCAEMIKPQAKVCRHCGKDVATAGPPVDP